MKNTLLALVLFAFAGSTAFAHDGHDKPGQKGKKETCTMKGGMAGGSSCCMKGAKTAAVKPVAKPVAVVKL